MTTDPIEVQILAINDFHGYLEPPRQAIDATLPDGTPVKVPAGGASYLASAAKALRAGKPHSITVSAGDLISGGPLVSTLYLDEPTIEVMEEVGLELNAVGNHEFDRGRDELLRMQNGGCEKHTTRAPCAVQPFDGADFKFLAANVRSGDGATLFPGTVIREFGPVKIGFIGMTLQGTATIVTPAGVAGLTFEDEAATANAAIPAMKAAGTNAIVLLIHQGGRTGAGYNDKSCPNLDGEIMPIRAKLDPEIDLVISGHTHQAYICERPRASAPPLLLTSAGQFGTLISDIRLTFAPDGTLRSQQANNVIVQGESFVGTAGEVPIQPAITAYPPDAPTEALVSLYGKAAEPLAGRVVGTLDGPLTRQRSPARELTGGLFIADAQLAATKHLGAQIAFSNSGGVRADIIPGRNGEITFGQLFAMQPFGNNLVVKTLTGARLKALLEQQFESGFNTLKRPSILQPSQGFFFAYDMSQPSGQRIVEMKLDGKPIETGANYRIAIVNFLSTGGDNFTIFKEGTDLIDPNIVDVEASEAYLKAGAKVPPLGRIEDRTPEGWLPPN
ncbi:MAG TPA: bifunctional metallophosphatase/5'-nucleotidase [Sphingomicrobium sp.]|nr:bifunctional metallophosphatase/5'-nucleotidase [Sphingomicrobium sp.]